MSIISASRERQREQFPPEGRVWQAGTLLLPRRDDSATNASTAVANARGAASSSATRAAAAASAQARARVEGAPSTDNTYVLGQRDTRYFQSRPLSEARRAYRRRYVRFQAS